MENIFLQVLEISIMASYLIVAVLLIRGCFKKASASFKCILWLLVGVRLLVPVTISTPFGLVPQVEIANEQEAEDSNQANVQDYQGDWQYQSATAGLSGTWKPEEDVYPGGTMGVGAVDTTIVGNAAVSDAVTNVGQSGANDMSIGKGMSDETNMVEVLKSAVAYVWLGGMALMLCYMLFSWLRLYRSLRTAIPEMVEMDGRQIKVYRAENIRSPFLFGALSPKIYLPYDIVGKDVAYVLAHELMHIHRKDHLLKPISFIVLALYWFNPLVWVAYFLLGKDIELACDEQVLRANQTMDRNGYAQALLTCGSGKSKFYVCPVAFGESDVKVRVKNVLNYKKPGFLVALICVIVCVVVALCFMTVSEEQADGDAVTVSGELEQDVTGKDGTADENGPSAEPTTTPTVEPTTESTAEPTAEPTQAPTATPQPVATPVPTIVPEDYMPGPIEGYTEAQSKQIREELAKRIVYEKSESFNTVSVYLDSTDEEKGTSLGAFFLPKEAQFYSLDVVNRIEAVKMDGNDWLAVTVVANISKDDKTFPYEGSSLEILVDVDRESDGSIIFGSIYQTSKMADRTSGTSEHAYYEENNYTRVQINLLKADVTHDGIEDYIETYMYVAPETDITVGIDELVQKQMLYDGVYVSVYDGSVATESDYGDSIMTGSYSSAHAGNGQLNIVYQDGLAYLMKTSVYAGQGTQSYFYRVYTLDAKGRYYVKETYSDGFYTPDYTQIEQDSFANNFTGAMEPWLEGGKLIVGADIDLKEQMVSTENRSYASSEFYDRFFR